MTKPVVRGAGRRVGGGMIPLLVAAVAVAAVAGWLLTGQPGGLYAGYAGGPVALVAAVVAAHRLGSTVKMASQLRAFWGQLSQAAILLLADGIADGEDRGRLAVAAAVAQLAEYLQLSAVAEGIESEAQLDRLRSMGYRLGQGFYMAKPMPADEAGCLMAADPIQVS